MPHFPRPTISFPIPALDFDFRIAVALNPEPSRVENKIKKEITTVAAGQWSGSFGNGRVLVGGLGAVTEALHKAVCTLMC